jgi:hypothetical protein
VFGLRVIVTNQSWGKGRESDIVSVKDVPRLLPWLGFASIIRLTCLSYTVTIPTHFGIHLKKKLVTLKTQAEHAVAQLVEALRYKPKVAGSIPDDVIGIFHLHNPSSRTMALGST